MDGKTKPLDRYVSVDGLRLRYIERGTGAAVLFLHGASLGSSADVFLRNLLQFSNAGFRAVAFDLPGFGLSDIPEKQSVAQQRNAIPKFIDAMGLGRTALMAHSRSGAFAIQLALDDPQRYSHIVILGTGSLLPLQDKSQVGRYETVQTRVDREMGQQAPTLDDSRKLLEADTFNHHMISDDDVAIRNSRSTGRNFAAHIARLENDAVGGSAATPLWQRLPELKVPLLMIYGHQDRAHAAARAGLLKQMRPDLNLHIVDKCKHMVHWDAEAELRRLVVPFLRKQQNFVLP